MNKQTKLGILILTILLAIISIIFIAVSHNEKEENKISTTWGKTYYKYLTGNDISLDAKNSVMMYTIDFYEVEGMEDPVMSIEYKKDNKKYSNINFISGNEIKFINAQDPLTVELLYNKETKKYEYYTHMISSAGGDYYEDLKSQLINSTKSAEDTTRVKTEGYYFTEKSNSKFEDTFKKIEVKRQDVSLNIKSTNDEVRGVIIEKIKEYKPVKELTKEN